MRSRVGQSHQSIPLIVLSALLTLGTSSLKAQPDNRDPSPERFLSSEVPNVGRSAAAGQSLRQLRDDGRVVVNTDLVTLKVNVVDGSGRSVTGLDKQAFTILDDRSPQEITFFSDVDEPVSVNIVFDLSGSMSSEKIQLAREALSHFIETSLDSDEYSLIAFNDRPQLLLERTRDAKAILDKLSAVVPHEIHPLRWMR